MPTQNTKPPKAVLARMGLGSVRGFKTLKRKQVRNALRAIHYLWHASLYTPDRGNSVDRANKALQELAEMMKVKNWGRD